VNTNDDHIVVRGQSLTVEFGVLNDGSMPAREFLDSLQLKDGARLLAILKGVAEHGVLGLNNDRIFKQERDFWAAKKDHCKGGPKGRKMIRLVAFLSRDRLVLTHGFWKPPKGPWDEREFTTAERIRNEIRAREQR
jgi:hypothetical protein